VKLPLHVPTSCGCSLAVMHQQTKVASSCFVLERNASQSCLFQYVSHPCHVSSKSIECCRCGMFSRPTYVMACYQVRHSNKAHVPGLGWFLVWFLVWSAQQLMHACTLLLHTTLLRSPSLNHNPPRLCLVVCLRASCGQQVTWLVAGTGWSWNPHHGCTLVLQTLTCFGVWWPHFEYRV
jgi:hypothetical protein